MNVLSLFDGMSCGQIALNKLGVKYDNYFASEIDKFAIKVTQANYPNTKQLGDICELDTSVLPQIDLLIGGSPCQSFSRSGDGSGFDGKSKLFFEFVRILKETKPKYFLLENVVMKKEWENVITEIMGVSPIKVNSKMFSAGNRTRLYWTNIPQTALPLFGCGDVVRDILEENAVWTEPSKCLINKFCDKRRIDIVKHVDEKANCLTATMWKGQICSYVKNDEGLVHKLTPRECEAIHNVPTDYTAHVSNTQRYKMIGNGWNVDTVCHLFKWIAEEQKPMKRVA